MAEIIQEYFAALERLEKGRPLNLPKGTKITNDAVSIEAGRKKGTIKKSRPIFAELIRAIDATASQQCAPQDTLKEQLTGAKADSSRYRALWEEALKREVSLVKQLWAERYEWATEKSALTGEKVSSILSRKLVKR